MVILPVTMASSTESLPRPPSDLALTPLERLVSHLVSAKRSLSSINHVWRANEIVESARKSLETNAISVARSDFLKRGIEAQVNLLAQVQKNTRAVEEEGAMEFDAVIGKLDVADERLGRTMGQLRATIVEASLRPTEEEQRSLLDFVDESGVDSLHSAIKESIDTANRARQDLSAFNANFYEELAHVNRMVKPQEIRTMMHKSTEYAGSPVPEILQDMEDHAKEMADNLESLVTHFDLCVAAIKHTEGGGDTARQITGDLPKGVDVGQDVIDTPPDSISEDERREMMEVLEKDAAEVEDVVMEIRDRMIEMENQDEVVRNHSDMVSQELANTTSAFSLLEKIGTRLPEAISQSHVFLMRWDDEKAKIEEGLEGLQEMKDFYDGFLRAYDNLIIEISRRKMLELKMQSVVQNAMAQVEKLYEEDAEERGAFENDQGFHLPNDIWPGLKDGPSRYEILPVNGVMKSVPEISDSAVQRALRRVSQIS